MNKKITKSIIAPAVCLSIMLSGSGSIFASKFEDSDTHWAKDAIDRWAEHGVVEGSDGLFMPDNSMTRAEMAVMINRIMNYQETAENIFSDLPDSWYTDAILKLVKQGVMEGYNNHIRPEDPVSREESLVMLARALNLNSKRTKNGISFNDAANISEWAKDAVQAMTEGGFINGYEDGTFRPRELMTRASFVTVVNNSVKGFYNKPGTYKADEEINGFVIVNSPDVVLEGMTINGDLIVSPGVKEGKVVLRGTTVSGQQIVMSGSVESKPGNTNPGEDNDNNTENEDSDNNTGGNTGGSGSGSGGGGGSGISTAVSTDIIVNSAYADKTGKVTANGKRYTIGENAFDTLQAAVSKAHSLGKKASVTLMSDLSLDNTIVLSSDNLTLDGNDHTVTFNAGVKDGIQIVDADNIIVREINIRMQDEADKWNGSYGIQAYISKVTLKDVTASGADAGVLVNASDVTLQGIINVTGNEFGGIEVSKGALAETMPYLSGKASNLKNETEAIGKPTVWIDKVSELTRDVVSVPGLIEGMTEKDQAHYYLSQSASVTAYVSDLNGFETALANEDIKIINLTDDIVSDKTISIMRSVTINGQNGAKTITFDNKNGIQTVNAGEIRIENINLQVTGNTSGWQGIYALQIYGSSKAVLKNVTATGADGGILVNASDVTLEGIINVTGNEFGGIEVSKGTQAQTIPRLSGTAANLKNETEESGKPTVWIDKVSELTNAVVAVSGLYENTVDEKDQAHYYLSEIIPITK